MVSPVAILFLLKNAPNCTSKHPYFQKFSGGACPQTPLGAQLTRQVASRQLAFAHQKNYPQRFSGSAPVLSCSTEPKQSSITLATLLARTKSLKPNRCSIEPLVQKCPWTTQLFSGMNTIDQTFNVIVMTRKYRTEPTAFVDVVSFHLTLPLVDILGCSICIGCNV